MSKQDYITSLIKQISGQANILAIPRIYIDIVSTEDHADLAAALFLSQCIYWSDKGAAGGGWFWKSAKDWHDEIGLSPYQVRRSTEKLENLKIIETMLKRARSAPTIHYRVDFTQLTNSIINKLDNRETSQTDCEETQKSDSEETSQTLTETTTKITAKTTLPEEGGTSPNLFKLYTDNIGIITPRMSDILQDAEKTYPAGWFEPAFEIAIKKNARNWSYIGAILDRWQREGFMSDSRPKNGNGRKNGKTKPDANEAKLDPSYYRKSEYADTYDN